MDNEKIVEEIVERLEDEGNDATKRAVLRTDLIEAMHMTDGDEEVLPPMTPETLEAFLNAEDEALKEDRGVLPVADQLETTPSESVTIEEIEADMEERRQYLQDVDDRRNGQSKS